MTSRGSAMHGRAVHQAYIDTNALERDCPNCRAVIGEFCVFPDGSERHVPCCGRIRTQKEPA